MAEMVSHLSDADWNLMVIPLKFTWQPTKDELIYLKKLIHFRMMQSKIEQDNKNPSVIIDNFLYHGNLKHAMNKTLLEQLDIKYIINMSEFSLGEDIVNQHHVLSINLEDDTYTDIDQHFKTTNEFLQSCKNQNKKVLVNCQMGVSRSSTIILAYLLKYHYNTLEEAYEHVLKRRPCAEPNLGFLLQLIRYENELHKSNAIEISTNIQLNTSARTPTSVSNSSWRQLCCLSTTNTQSL